MKKRVAFDFDGTLGHREDVQSYCKSLIDSGDVDVFIVTRRYGEGKSNKDDHWWVRVRESNWLEVYEKADLLGVKRENIVFLNMLDKVCYFRDNDFLWHLDDDEIEVDFINEQTKTVGIYVKDLDWELTCNELLKHKELA
jgi:hypothetical protein